jgi:hypothetical protein
MKNHKFCSAKIPRIVKNEQDEQVVRLFKKNLNNS